MAGWEVIARRRSGDIVPRPPGDGSPERYAENGSALTAVVLAFALPFRLAAAQNLQ